MCSGGRQARLPRAAVSTRRIEKFREILRQLPNAHYDTLRVLIRHLSRVADPKHNNKMQASNLAIVFAPSIMPEVLKNTKQSIEVVTTLILHATDIL